MTTVNMLEAKSTLSKLVAQIESGAVSEIVLARNGRPIARIVPLAPSPVERRLGIARGRLTIPNDLDASNDEVLRLFGIEP